MKTHALFDLSGRRALVTGSSKGIGAALAVGLAEAGAELVLNGRDAAALERAREELAERTGAKVHTAAFDVTDEVAVLRAVRKIEDGVGPVDILVNNTGVQHREPLLKVSAANFERVLHTNLTSAFLVGRAVAAGMVERGHGKIVNICSVQTWLARPGIAAYAASKGGLAMLTRGMCAEWAGSGITVNALAPGYVVTELTRPLVEDPAFDSWIRGRTPAGRWAGVEDLVGTLVWLAAPASDFVNGQVIAVDGGLTAVV
ncbi:SDR family NAD(P)-dependent oxidoreductase [Streptomyces sp. DSM 15324]|uniref:SDR family NAD(P)-dependent oxidoreductase n=1 Tax=Streptomyces sp. DSM 15324 TaxID=1739111 RepID=UPI000748210D|nr:SDR family NAD(P)-dependent oxidoreductase [Streptomyces sp. DSM 15324]KUO09298.1 gluconate 5-dehydrogenase [Streptomyces sp. DSM 15324]